MEIKENDIYFPKVIAKKKKRKIQKKSKKERQKASSWFTKKTLLILVLTGILISLLTLSLQAIPPPSQDQYIMDVQSEGEGQVQFTVKENPIPKDVSEEATVTFTVKKRE